MSVVYSALRFDGGVTMDFLTDATGLSESNVRRMISELRIILTGHHEIVFKNGFYKIV
tara:strand:- start:201 stop:374 length:174 start_codon:yes stop_codon:yes gene_type:complete